MVVSGVKEVCECYKLYLYTHKRYIMGIYARRLQLIEPVVWAKDVGVVSIGHLTIDDGEGWIGILARVIFVLRFLKGLRALSRTKRTSSHANQN